MNAKERAEAKAALEKVRSDVRTLLGYCKKKTGHAHSHWDPEYAHAFGLWSGIARLGWTLDPSRGDSEFQRIVDEVQADASVQAAPGSLPCGHDARELITTPQGKAVCGRCAAADYLASLAETAPEECACRTASNTIRWKKFPDGTMHCSLCGQVQA